MDPLGIAFLIGCAVFTATFSVFIVLRARDHKRHARKCAAYESRISGLQEELEKTRDPASAKGEGVIALHGAARLRSLSHRARRLGFQYSEIASAALLASLEKAFQPKHSYYANQLQRPAGCLRCAGESLRFVYAGASEAFEGCLGCYCFTCGYGVCSNRRLIKTLSDEAHSDLFELFRRWESPSASTETAQASTDTAAPAAAEAAPAPGPATETAAPTES